MSGGEGELVITTLRALVKVKGEPPRVLSRGDALPDDALPGEAKRLAGLNALGRRKPAPVAPPDATDDDTSGAGTAPATPVDIDIMDTDTETLSKFLAEGKDGHPFTIPEVEAMAADDDPATAAALARKLLEAEQHRSGGDPRDGLTKSLVKLIEADPTPAS